MTKAATFKLGEAAPLVEAASAQIKAKADYMDAIRSAAAARTTQLGLPNQKQEEWRFVNLRPLVETHFALPAEDADASAIMEKMEAEGLLALAENRVVFINGQYRAELSELSQLPAGVTVKTLAEAASDAFVKDNFAQVATDEAHPFMALSTAMFSDGLAIHIPAKVVVEKAIQVLYLTTDADTPVIITPRLLVVAETSSQATIIETYGGPDDQPYFVNPVSEFVVEEDAVLYHYRLQLDGNQAFHMATADARQKRASQFGTHTFTFGGRLTRNDTGLHMDGQGGHGTMNGLYQLADSQFVDNHTRIDHAFPNCETHELFKGILDDHSRGVFNGRIMVRQIAQKTDSKQTNRTLLLSSDALINTNPQLEIFADDVKCTHGATIGQLEPTQLYYLRSRGISEAEARQILVYAFANDVVERVSYEPLRNFLEQKLLAAQEAKAALAKA